MAALSPILVTLPLIVFTKPHEIQPAIIRDTLKLVLICTSILRISADFYFFATQMRMKSNEVSIRKAVPPELGDFSLLGK